MSWLRWTLYSALGLLFVLHNDVWNWDDPNRVLGVPVGLLYHILFCFACAGVMSLLSRYAWPALKAQDRERAKDL